MFTPSESVLDFLKDDGPEEVKVPKERTQILRADVSGYHGIVGTIRRKSSAKIIKFELRRHLSRDEMGVVGDGVSQFVREMEDFVHRFPVNFTTTANVRYSHPTFMHPGWGHFRRTARNIYYYFYVDAEIFAGEEAVMDLIADYFDENNALLVIDYQTEIYLQDLQKKVLLQTTPASRYIKGGNISTILSSTPGLLLYNKETGTLVAEQGTDDFQIPFFPHTNKSLQGYTITCYNENNNPQVYFEINAGDRRRNRNYVITPKQDIGEWFLSYANTSLDVIYNVEFQKVVELIKRKNIERGWELWEHQIHDLATLILKHRVLLSANVGTGKTRVFVAAMDILSGGNSGVFVEAGLLPEFQKEYQNFKGKQKVQIAREMLNPPKDVPTLLTYSSLNNDIQDPFLKKSILEKGAKERARLIASMERWINETETVYHSRQQLKAMNDELEELKEESAEAKLADIFSNWKFNFLGFDESHNLKKETSNRFKKCAAIKSNYRLAASGTITTGNPKDVFSQLKMVMSGSDQPMRILVRGTQGLRYVSYNQALAAFIKRNKVGSKVIDQISDLKAWRETIDPYVVYTDKNSPKVSKSHVFKKYTMHVQRVVPDRQQFMMFASNIKKFGEEVKDYKITSDLDILARMRFLADISAAPQLPEVSGKFEQPYTGLTEKQKKVIEYIDLEIKQDNQVILFTERNDTAVLMSKLITEHSTAGAIVANTAGLGVKQRFEAIERFRKGGATVIVGSYKGLGRGYNLPQASAVILYELYWTIDVEEQAIGRVMRPQQQQTPRVYMVYNSGMIDDYQATQILRSRRRNSDIIINGTTSIIESPILTYREVAKQMLNYLDTLPKKAKDMKLGEEVVHELAL